MRNEQAAVGKEFTGEDNGRGDADTGHGWNVTLRTHRPGLFICRQFVGECGCGGGGDGRMRKGMGWHGKGRAGFVRRSQEAGGAAVSGEAARQQGAAKERAGEGSSGPEM